MPQASQSQTREAPVALPMQTRLAPINTVDAPARTVEVTFTTGAAVRRRRYVGWDTSVPFDEVLAVSREAVNLERLNNGAPVLDSHALWSLANVRGVVDKAWIAHGEGRAILRFPSKGVIEDADRLFDLIEQRIVTKVSVGYSIDKLRIVAPEKPGEVEKRIADRWTPYEISFVTIPADPGATVRNEDAAVYPLEIAEFTRAMPTTMETPMPDPVIDSAGTEPANEVRHTPAAPNVGSAGAAPTPAAGDLAAERRRSAEITTLALNHRMPDGFARQHIEAGTSLEDIRGLVLARVQADQASTRINPRVEVVADEGDVVRQAVETAITLRARPQSIRPDTAENRSMIDAARNWRGMTLLEMGRLFIEETQGVRLRNLSRRELAGVCLGLTRAAGMSTSDFPNILANVASKRLRSAYEAAPSAWKRIARQSNAPDFKERAVTQLSNLPKFKKVREGQEFEYAALTDAQEKYALSTFGRIVPITRQTLVNDDLGAFDRLPALLGRAAAELEMSVFWDIFVLNGNMADGVALFHATHGNLGTAALINETSLSEGRQKMREQKGFAAKAADAEPLNIIPRFLIVSPAKETEAQKMLVAVTATKSGDVNIFQGSLELLVEARLTGNAWYLSADPAQIDTIEYAYLEGEEGLYTETRIGFEVDGIEVKGRVDFAAKAIDHRGLFKNAGA